VWRRSVRGWDPFPYQVEFWRAGVDMIPYPHEEVDAPMRGLTPLLKRRGTRDLRTIDHQILLTITILAMPTPIART
jgi:hypothetical protein